MIWMVKLTTFRQQLHEALSTNLPAQNFLNKQVASNK
ncbi:uncharacterized protein METZ01_LOCUS59933 [marine metagenome]|uniref:Uncharacterized protein n=1 Tax=marine metagenome TaxID=408172 RepID=A0A381SUE9_9ZZZZ